MSWEKDPLWSKARLFFERAFRDQHDPPVFGLWCSLGLELLARAALASVSPTLLAAPDKDHKNLLFALNRGAGPGRSLGMFEAIDLCQRLFKEFFTPEDATAARLLINLRNEELHSGSAAFETVSPDKWLPGFYRACKNLCKAMHYTLEDLLNEAEAEAAEEMLVEIEREVIGRVKAAIATSSRSFKNRTVDERDEFAATAEAKVAELVFQQHHRVACPACGSAATVEGEPFGPERVENREDEIVVRRSVVPRKFTCIACGLALKGYAELSVAELGGYYTRTSRFCPEEFYNFDPRDYADIYPHDDRDEYDNE